MSSPSWACPLWAGSHKGFSRHVPAGTRCSGDYGVEICEGHRRRPAPHAGTRPLWLRAQVSIKSSSKDIALCDPGRSPVPSCFPSCAAETPTRFTYPLRPRAGFNGRSSGHLTIATVTASTISWCAPPSPAVSLAA